MMDHLNALTDAELVSFAEHDPRYCTDPLFTELINRIDAKKDAGRGDARLSRNPARRVQGVQATARHLVINMEGTMTGRMKMKSASFEEVPRVR